MNLSQRHVVVAVGLEGLVVAHSCFAMGTAVEAFFHLGLVCLIPAIGVLATVVRVIGVPDETFHDGQRALGDILDAAPLILVGIFVNKRQGVVVLRTDIRLIPTAIGIVDGVGGRVVVHGVEHAHAIVAKRHTLELALHGVHAERHFQTVLQDFRREQRAGVHAVHACTTYGTLAVHVVHRSHVFGLLVAAADADVVVMRQTGAQHFVLPIGVGTAILLRTHEA